MAGPCSDSPGQGLITAIAGYVGVEVPPEGAAEGPVGGPSLGAGA